MNEFRSSAAKPPHLVPAPLLFNLKGARAMVTGAARGIGRAIAEGLAERGVHVVLIDVLPEGRQVALELAEAGLSAHFVAADLARSEDIDDTFSQALDHFGGQLDILVNNAGVNPACSLQETSVDIWSRTFDINVTSALMLSRLAVSPMTKAGKGKIINVGSIRSFVGSVGSPAYSATKGAVVQMTRSLSNELAPRNIYVNALAPGFFETEMTRPILANAQAHQVTLDRIPAGRWGVPADIVGSAVFLASAASDYVSGAVIPCDGGFLCR